MTHPKKIGGCSYCHGDRKHHRGDRRIFFECGSRMDLRGTVQSEECKIATAVGGWDEYQEKKHATT